MKIVVNDANILIDLVELELLNPFFQLKFEFLTTSLIVDELFVEHQKMLNPILENGILKVSERNTFTYMSNLNICLT